MPDEARETLERLAKSRNAPCIYAPDVVSTEDIPDGFALSGKFNRENALTALAALGVIGIDRRAVEKGFSSVEWQGRFQKLVWRGRRFIVDGAHNPPAMRALVDSLKEEMAQGLFTVQSVVCGFCGDKDVSANLSILREIADCGMAVSICNPRTLPADATQQQMRKAGFAEATSCRSLEEALSRSPDGTVVCGSLFLAGEALAMMDAFPYKVCGTFPNETFVSA
jgi:dihydrofolate synthase/folylpolyglutamate synthase